MLTDDRFLRELNFRKNITVGFIIFLCLILIFNLYLLQIKHGHKYQLMSDKNRIRINPILPKRGRILSSDGQVLAQNIYKHRLMMDYCSKKVFDENMKSIKQYLNFSDEDEQALNLIRQQRQPSFLIKDELTKEEYAKIAMNLFKFSGVYLTHIYSRQYYMPEEFSHVIGYATKSDNSLQILKGKTGIEFLFDEQLCGQIGTIQKEINAVGKNIRTIDQQPPKSGDDIILTINADLQKYVYQLLSQHKAGACCVLDISGNVLALVSFPGYDINIMSNGPTKSEWNELNTNTFKPLLDRAISSAYPPGSIFKIIVAYAALKEKIISPTDKIICLGGVKQDNHVFHCWNRGGHGWMNLCDALKFSCDSYFFELAMKLGIEKIRKYALEFGFGHQTGIELPNEKTGLIPSKEWKLLRYGSTWKPYETIIAGIGQGSVLTTLIQTATMMGKLYTNDFNYHPTMIRQTSENEISPRPIDKQVGDIIKKGLYQVCYAGTARGSCRTLYGISGKTGSSQVRSIKSHEAGMNQKLVEWQHRDHAFFAGVAPLNTPKYIVAVLVEHGGGGASVAAPIARKVFDKLMEHDGIL